MATVIDPRDLDLGSARNTAPAAPAAAPVASGPAATVSPADLASAITPPAVQMPAGGAAPGGALRGLMLGARNVGPYAAASAGGAGLGTALLGPGPGTAFGAVAGPTALGLTDLAITGYNAVAPLFGAQRAPTATDAFDRLMDMAGLPRPQSTGEKVVANVTRAALPAAATARTAQTMSQTPAALPTAQNVGRNMLGLLGQAPGTQAVAAAGGAAAPTIAQEVFDIQNPLALMGISASGAMLAGGTASRFTNAVSGGNYRDPVVGDLVERARAQGVNLTPADVAPQGAGRVQRGARTAGLTAEARASERAGEVTNLIDRNVDGARPAAVTATGSADRAVAADLRTQYNAAKDTARTMYTAVDTAIAAQPGSGVMAPATTQQVAVQLRQNFPEWATLTNASRATSARLDGIVQGTGPRQSTIMGPNGQPMQMPGQASFADMRKLSTEVGQLVEATRTDPKLAAVHGQLKQLYGAIQQDVDNWAQSTTNRAAADAYGQAQTFFRNNVAPFRDDPTIYRTVSSRTPRADFDKQAQKLTESLMGAGNETTQLAVNLMSPEGRQAFAYSIMEKARARSVNPDNAAEFTAPGYMRGMNLGRPDTPTPQRIAMQGAPGVLPQAELTGQIVDATRGALTPKVAPQTGQRLLPLATTGAAGSMGEAAGQALGLPPLVGGTVGMVGVPMAARGLDALMGTQAGTRFSLGAPYRPGAGLLSIPMFSQGQQ